MSFCTCGKTAETFGGLCTRCGALQSLGLGTSASAADIEAAYRTLVKVWHPDRFQNDLKLKLAADEKLKEINAAHEFLIAEPPTPESFSPAAEPEPSRPQRERPAEVPIFVSEATRDQELPRGRGYAFAAKILLRILIAGGSIAAMALMWLSADSLLSSSPRSAGVWIQYKAGVSSELHAFGSRLWTDAKENLHATRTENALPPALPSPQTNPQHIEPSAHIKPREQASKAHPYVTSGLTPLEVLAILGKPTFSSGTRMSYGESEIEFKNGQVVGWKIDPRSPIRVKLWSDRPLAPGTVVFAVGSSKSDVIALQGTPNVFSDNEFHYGGSVVIFQNDQVVGWKEAPASVQLRVPH
jgi:DnaJ domain